jgi:hypothetical protein
MHDSFKTWHQKIQILLFNPCMDTINHSTKSLAPFFISKHIYFDFSLFFYPSRFIINFANLINFETKICKSFFNFNNTFKFIYWGHHFHYSSHLLSLPSFIYFSSSQIFITYRDLSFSGPILCKSLHFSI